MTNYQKILFEVDQGIARVTLNRPDKRNALDGELVNELRDAFQQCAADSGIGVVVLKGAGKDFCSGADLSALQQSSTTGVMDNLADARRMAELFLQMRRHPRPIIAAVRGRALAGGCGLATAADIVLAAQSAQFGYPEVNVGFVPAMVMAILRRSLSEKRAFELITLGEIIPATTALAWGMINRVFADDRFDDEVDAYTTKLASKSHSAVMLSKSLLYHMDALTFEAAVDAGTQLNVIARMTEDCQRGLQKFLGQA